MLEREVCHLVDQFLRVLACVGSANTTAMMMGFQHDARGFIITLAEYGLENVDDELHWRLVVVQHQDDRFFGRFDPLATLVFSLSMQEE